MDESTLRVAPTRIESGETRARRRQRDQFPKDRGTSDIGLGQRVLQGEKDPFGVLRFLGDVREQLVEVELVVVAGDPFQDRSLRPLEGSPQFRR